jgi:hypothetical protein
MGDAHAAGAEAHAEAPKSVNRSQSALFYQIMRTGPAMRSPILHDKLADERRDFI